MSFWSGLIARGTKPSLHTRPSLTLFYLVLGAYVFTLLPHYVLFPTWLTVTILVAMAARALIEYFRLPLPSTNFTGFLALILLLLIWAQYRTFVGRDAGTAWTAGLLTIKFYELRRARDVALIIFSCFFVVMSALLYSQVLELFIYCMIMMWILTALLLRVHTGDLPQDNVLRMLRQSGVIFLQALPLASFLFFFLPRYTGHLGFTLNEPAIGLSDTVEPGSIAKLADNDTEVMYVQFTGGDLPPDTDSMYWRALVLWHYEKGAWTAGPLSQNALYSFSPQTRPKPDQIQQEITVKPHHQRWLFALDCPVSLPLNQSESPSWAYANLGNVLQLSGFNKLDHTSRYEVISSLTPPVEKLQEAQEKASLQGINDPEDPIDPKVKALAVELHQGLEGPGHEKEYITKIIRYFRHEGFVYTKSPGVEGVGSSWLEHFLFTNKAGFCEHYASAFAILLRLEGVHARMVVGYSGAEYNVYTDRYTVAQSNAHAWDEVWIPKESGSNIGSWERYDPTALIAMPEAGQTGASSSASSFTKQAQEQASFAETYLPQWAQDDLKEIKLRREEVETNWDNLVLAYDPEAQMRLAQSLGWGQKAEIGLVLASLAAISVCVFVFQKWMKREPAPAPIETVYATFCRNMAQRGIPRASWEGPLAYTERVAEAFPEEKATLQRVGSIVAHARYASAPPPDATPETLKSLLTLLSASQAASISRERN